MRKTLLGSALIICGLLGASAAKADSLCNAIANNLVTNCGFETGDFTGWTVGGSIDNPGNNYYGVDGFDANSGNFGAYMSQDFLDQGKSSVTLSQTLATSIGSTYTIEFWLEQDTAPTLGYTHAFTASFGGTSILSLMPTVALPGVVGTFTEYTFTETATSTSTVLKFSFENDDQFWSFDDASVVAPEPTSILLLGTLVLAVIVGLKRRQNIA